MILVVVLLLHAKMSHTHIQEGSWKKCKRCILRQVFRPLWVSHKCKKSLLDQCAFIGNSFKRLFNNIHVPYAKYQQDVACQMLISICFFFLLLLYPFDSYFNYMGVWHMYNLTFWWMSHSLIFAKFQRFNCLKHKRCYCIKCTQG